jgi:integrase
MDPHLSHLPSLELVPGPSGVREQAPTQPLTQPLTQPPSRQAGFTETPEAGEGFGVPAGLTMADAIRIAEAMSACHAESTRAIYAGAWQRWERWCTVRDIAAMPAHPAAICAYLAERAATGLSIGALDTDCSAIAYTHRRHRLPDPLCDEAVRAVRRGLRRMVGTAPRRQARPLGTTEIRQIVEAINRSMPKGARDAAIILLGYASALRRSELAALIPRAGRRRRRGRRYRDHAPLPASSAGHDVRLYRRFSNWIRLEVILRRQS